MADASDDDLKAKYREALARKSQSQHKSSTKGTAEGSRGAVRGPDKLAADGAARTAPSVDATGSADQLQPLVAPQDTHFRQVPLRTRVN